MTEEDDIDGLAAEYVLGSLNPGERTAVDQRRRGDRALADAIRAWERRLGPLNRRVGEIEPPAHLFEAILQRIQAPRAAEVVELRRHARRWRGIAAGAAAMAACLGLAVGWFLYERSLAPALLVAELYRPAGTSTADEIINPAFVVTVDVAACRITARPVTAQPRPGRNYQLWLVNASTPAPLAVLGGPGAVSAPCPQQVTAATLANATVAVSQEPDGGSPTGVPTGPFTFLGRLMAPAPVPGRAPSR
ncbi:MAG TPA: anti-sigma factor [Hyphomicrobiaceae bacterium]|jgi:anti-sigma-K factor RskA|nr:anti-sigma factor [Hyphomicrobiaceae bacterium]